MALGRIADLDRERDHLFRRLFDAHYHRILGYALRRRDDAQDAADVVAETFLTAWRRLDDLPRGGEELLWLYGIARRVVANSRRSDRRRTRLTERLREDFAARLRDELSSAAVEHGPEVTVQRGVIAEALEGLPEEDREVIRLVAWEGLSRAELGTVLGCTPNAATIRLHRARRRLAGRLREAGLDDEPALATRHTTGNRLRPPAAEEDER
ncbi:MAG TPA: sigma-70 family RNA polymerase sigma factor [Actinomycetota bacterium]|jgi:RNA polymerase sigma-70 factor (ECF subfamily)